MKNYFSGLKNPVHDDIVFTAAKHATVIAQWAHKQGVLAADPCAAEEGEDDAPEIDWGLEYELGNGRGYADLAIFRRRAWYYKGRTYWENEPDLILLAEIKSEREDQSASAWFRQVRSYAQMSGVPCVLVVAHDIGETQRNYLDLAGVPVCNIRGLF